MFNKTDIPKDKQEMYDLMIYQLKFLLDDVNDNIANLSNTSAIIDFYLKDINWAGFYIYKNNELVLGPFQGLPACVKIQVGIGVCGTAASTMTTQVVKDVDAFPGHIACDSASKSEIVIPLSVNNQLFGVLDIDSPNLDRFDDIDRVNLETLVNLLVTYITID